MNATEYEVVSESDFTHYPAASLEGGRGCTESPKGALGTSGGGHMVQGRSSHIPTAVPLIMEAWLCPFVHCNNQEAADKT